ncbi:MAG TPA: hypothetical protein VK335_15380 [Bryobacteraceae bacterium]|nr:hypothetical protein [Bryobacteraceae bacterium]
MASSTSNPHPRKHSIPLTVTANIARHITVYVIWLLMTYFVINGRMMKQPVVVRIVNHNAFRV